MKKRRHKIDEKKVVELAKACLNTNKPRIMNKIMNKVTRKYGAVQNWTMVSYIIDICLEDHEESVKELKETIDLLERELKTLGWKGVKEWKDKMGGKG